MSLHLNIEHRTQLSFAAPVDYTIQQLHLTPQDGFGQKVKHWEIRVNGRLQAHADAHGNLQHTLVVDAPHRSIEITAIGEVETGLDCSPPPDLLPLPVYLRDSPLTTADRRIRDFARLYLPGGGQVSAPVLDNLMHAIRDCVAWRNSAATPPVSAAEALAAGQGSCRELTHIFIACCRSLGVPARYVSGYLLKQGRLNRPGFRGG